MNRKDLANKIWSACDIMRRDDGTSGITEYMEQLSWMIFLKVFEDLEKRWEYEKSMEGESYSPIIDPEYRWSAWTSRDWKAGELIDFIDNKLFPYLRSLKGSDERERIASIFEDIRANRMKSEYNLKDVIQLLDDIDFNSAEDSHVLSQLYEELLLKMGSEGGVAGEFYTPRPIVRLMVKMVNPTMGERVLDPFCGSCGFLIESFKHMVASRGLTIEEHERLQRHTFYGQEKKPLPYLIGVMNCILNGLLTPAVVRKNTLEEDVHNLPEERRFEVVLTNPPFGGKEGKQVQQNFDVKSQATELLALQYVMRVLKRGGRCGIVVPEGILFRGDAFARVKKELIERFNVHTIISLPSGVFANVAPSGQGPKTNLLFFDKGSSTKEIWYYDFAHYSEVVLKKKYTKANPVLDEDLVDCYSRWQKREVSELSWVVPVEDVVERGYDLSARNPNIKDERVHEPPHVLLSEIRERESQIIEVLDEIESLLNGGA